LVEFGDYWRLVRRWWALLLTCTILAALVGEYLAHRSAARPTYDATATVAVSYITPNGVPYNSTLSKQDVTVALSNRARDPRVLQTVRKRYQLDQQAVSGVTASVALDAPVITIHAIGTTSTAAETFATGMAEELAAIEIRQLTAETTKLQGRQRAKANAAGKRFLRMEEKYYHVCGCIGGQTRPLVSRTTLEDLDANLSLLNQEWLSDVSDYKGITIGPTPAAAASPGSVSRVAGGSSTVKTVLPAAIVGLLLAIGLAALIDYIRDLPFFVRKRALQAEGPVVVSIEFKLRHHRETEARPDTQGRLSERNENPPDEMPRLTGGEQR
jgi:capsular polysaccharide biosynthesis protein